MKIDSSKELELGLFREGNALLRENNSYLMEKKINMNQNFLLTNNTNISHKSYATIIIETHK